MNLNYKKVEKLNNVDMSEDSWLKAIFDFLKHKDYHEVLIELDNYNNKIVCYSGTYIPIKSKRFALIFNDLMKNLYDNRVDEIWVQKIGEKEYMRLWKD